MQLSILELKDRYLKNLIIAAIITICLIVAFFGIGRFDPYNNYYIEPIRISIFLSFLGLLIPETEDSLINQIEACFVLILCIGLTYLELEMFNGNNLAEPFDGWAVMKIRLVLNWLIIGVYFLIFLTVFGRYALGMFAAILGLLIVGVGAYMILQFRGQIMLPSDALALSTAIGVRESYQLEFRSNLFAPLFLIVTQLIYVWRVRKVRFFKTGKSKIIARIVGVVSILFSVLLFYWSPVEQYYYPWFVPNNGYMFSVAMNVKMLTVIPDGSYSEEKVEEIIEEAPRATILDSNYDPVQAIQAAFPDYEGDKPNILCIMNESLADFEIYEKILTEETLLAEIKGLKEETIQGDLITEVFGGGTSDTEYTFLTSNSTKLFAENTRAYEVYFNDEKPSLLWNLKQDQYQTLALHPDKPENWSRDQVYPLLGFDSFITEEAFTDSEIVRDLYVSDAGTYELIKDLFEEKGKDPLFIFDITMQNHGSYNQSYQNLEKVELIEPSGILYPLAEQYLSLVKRSDQDFKALVEYFSQINEPTVILMFGDHQPKLDDGFYETVNGERTELSLEELRKEYTTPFIIWANYELPEDTVEMMSINYLAPLLTEVTGTGSSPYYNYLRGLYQEFPVIDRRGVLTASGEHLYFDQLNTLQEEKITAYNNVIYDNVFTDSLKKPIFTKEN